MTMTYKRKCFCQNEEYRKRFLKSAYEYNGEPYYRECLYCNGTGEVDAEIRNFQYEGDFIPVYPESPDETDIKILDDELDFRLQCSCGEDIFWSDDIMVCKCGRIYKFTFKVEKDDTHKGDTEFWNNVIENCKKEDEVRFG